MAFSQCENNCVCLCVCERLFYFPMTIRISALIYFLILTRSSAQWQLPHLTFNPCKQITRPAESMPTHLHLHALLTRKQTHTCDRSHTICNEAWGALMTPDKHKPYLSSPSHFIYGENESLHTHSPAHSQKIGVYSRLVDVSVPDFNVKWLGLYLYVNICILNIPTFLKMKIERLFNSIEEPFFKMVPQRTFNIWRTFNIL